MCPEWIDGIKTNLHTCFIVYFGDLDCMVEEHKYLLYTLLKLPMLPPQFASLTRLICQISLTILVAHSQKFQELVVNELIVID